MSHWGINRDDLTSKHSAVALLSLESKKATKSQIETTVLRLNVTADRVLAETPCFAEALILHGKKMKEPQYG